ncbi:MAG: TspO/MBR family protein [Sphingomonas sp.]
MTRAWLFPIVVAAIAASCVAALGATITVTDAWYHSLVQPTWAPPDISYGIVWTAIYALIVYAAATAWHAMRHPREAEVLIGLFALNGFLNILWSLLFFRLHRPDWALVEVVIFWGSILGLIVYIRPHSRRAASLLLPYLLWVGFAGYLNLRIVQLNPALG